MTLEQRFDRLEKSHRFWKRTAAALALLFAGTILIAQQARSGGTMALEELVIHDAAGQPRLLLTAQRGNATLSFYDGTGRHRMMLVAGQDGRTAVVQYDPAGGERIIQGIDPAGQASVSLLDAQNRERIVYGTGPDGRAAVEHYDASGFPRLSIYTQNDDRSGIDLFDIQQKKRLSLQVDRSAAGSYVYDHQGRLRVATFTNPQMEAGTTVHDPLGNRMILTGTLENGWAGSAYYGYDPQGRLVPTRSVP